MRGRYGSIGERPGAGAGEDTRRGYLRRPLAFASLAVFMPFHAAQAIARDEVVQAEVGWNMALARRLCPENAGLSISPLMALFVGTAKSLISCSSRNNETAHVASDSFMIWL
jgi:hypothetical protein